MGALRHHLLKGYAYTALPMHGLSNPFRCFIPDQFEPAATVVAGSWLE